MSLATVKGSCVSLYYNGRKRPFCVWRATNAAKRYGCIDLPDLENTKKKIER